MDRRAGTVACIVLALAAASSFCPARAQMDWNPFGKGQQTQPADAAGAAPANSYTQQTATPPSAGSVPPPSDLNWNPFRSPQDAPSQSAGSQSGARVRQHDPSDEERRIALDEEDDQLYSDERKVAGWLDQFCIWNHRFPEQGDQMRDAKDQLNQLVPNNPYSSGKLLVAQGLDVDPEYTNPTASPVEFPAPDYQAATENRIHLRLDPSLTELNIRQYQTQPPLEWNGPPGSIYAISNQQSLYVVWAAGRDGLPIRDPNTHRVRLIIGRYALLNQNDY